MKERISLPTVRSRSGTVDGPDRDRAEARLIAVVLLFGFVSIAVTGLVVVGEQTNQDLHRSIGDQQARTMLVQVGSEIDSVAASGSRVRGVDLSPTNVPETATADNAGRIVVEKRTLSGSTTVVDRPLGTVRFDGGRSTFAYQGGAIWRESNAGATLVSAPSMSYRTGGNSRDATLTVPITTFQGSARGSGSVSLAKNQSASSLQSLAVNDSEQVVVSITSEFYRGWADYYEKRVGQDAVVVDDASNTVTVTFGRRGVADTFDHGISSGGEVTISTSGTVRGPVTGDDVELDDSNTLQCADGSGSACYDEGNATATDMTPLIEDRMDDAAADPSLQASINVTGSTLTAGTYYVDSDVLLQDDLTFDVGTGNVTLLIDGDVAVDNQVIQVKNGSGTSNAVRVYTTGDVAIGGGSAGVTVASGDAKRFQLYGTKGMQFALGQAGSGFTGVVYAPQDGDGGDDTNDAVELANLHSAASACDDGVDVCLGQGSTSFTGAIVGGSTEIGQSVDFTYDDDLAGVSPVPPTLGSDPLPVSHLHVAVDVVAVE